ncbi:MAG: GTP-binding protein [Enterocloster clostridioformis]
MSPRLQGTTRDTLEEHIYLQGISLNVVDTAGIRDTEDVVEKIGVDRALKAARDADLIIYVVDGSRPLDESDREIMDFIRGRKTIVLLNKSDLDLEVGTEELEQLCGHKVILFQQRKNRGLSCWSRKSRSCFIMATCLSNDQVYITNARHKEALEQCLESLLMVKGKR